MNILITGISSGIGQGLCRYYLSNGHSVWGMSRRGYGRIEKSLTDWTVDLADTEALPNALEQLDFPNGGFDLVVLNAGILGPIRDMRDSTLSDLRAMMDVNLWANKLLVDHLIKHELCRDLVIGISSGASVSGHRGWNGYAISKAALNMLMSLYAGENPNVHFIALAPGLVDSPMQSYIATLDPGDTLPTISRIQSCRGTDKMPAPDTFAPRFDSVLAQLKTIDSGSFVDIRTL